MNSNKFKYELGLEAKDIVTGFKGILIGRAMHLTGCNTYGIAPKASEEKTFESQWFDENRIEIIGKGITKGFKKLSEDIDSGGPQEHPKIY